MSFILTHLTPLKLKAKKLKDACSLEAMTNLDSILKMQRDYFADKGPYCQSYGFSSSRELK